MRKSDANEETALEVKLREKTSSPCAAAVQTSEQRVELRALPLSDDLLVPRALLLLCWLFNVTALYMWRSNVLRLRKCSSAAAWRNSRWYSSQTGLPITNEEFRQAMKDGFADPTFFPGRGGSDVLRLGFAISGGVDSMALAALYANLRSSEPTMVAPHAFIVDHKVRPESTEEAEWVAHQCRSKFGMDATVLPLSWPAHFDPLDHSHFETDARALRYQALGRACRAANIRSLMVAHHADDQAETVLMRLANNRLRSGLQAMQPVEWIPECYGMHGISHSGGDKSMDQKQGRLERMPFPVEKGGVRILRPLLGFDKTRLIATCEQNGVSWAEDKTNHLRTYTSRNAIRHVLKNHRLPAALSIKSLVDTSRHMQDRINTHKSRAESLLQECELRLDLQTGSLRVRFPPFERFFQTTHRTRSDLAYAKNDAVYLLARVGQMIAPRDTPPLGELAATVENIWPEFCELQDTDSHQVIFKGNGENYCIYGIWWRRLKALNKQSSYQPEWLLSRQPIEHHRPSAHSMNISYPPSHILPLTQNVALPHIEEQRRMWRLFDGRWWIRLQNYSVDTLVLRLLTKEDLARFQSLHVAKRSGPERFVATALSQLKPSDLRLSLPAVFRQDGATKEETLVGLPTLNVSLGQLGYANDVCSWRVHYKKVDLTASQLEKVVIPGITHAMIEKELAKFELKPKKTARKSMKMKNTTRVRTGSTAQATGDRTPSDNTLLGAPASQPPDVSKGSNTVPLVPVSESKRRGRSEKGKGGGYNIKWEDFKDRF